VLHRRSAVVPGRDPGAGQSSVYTEYHERILNVVDRLAVEKVRSFDETLIAIRGIVNVGRALGGRPAGQSRSAWRRSVPSPF
jgi:hypothetical protein